MGSLLIASIINSLGEQNSCVQDQRFDMKLDLNRYYGAIAGDNVLQMHKPSQ